MWKIKQIVLHSIIQAAQNTHPNEFVAFLGGDKKQKMVTGLIILPAVFGTEHAIIRSDLLPWNAQSLGSVHSHPGFSNRPSPEDKKMFQQQGEIHLIICMPFSLQTIQAFDHNGKPAGFETIE